MPHISLPDAPGILAPMLAYPDAARVLNALAEHLLRGPSPLSPAERELIAACVSAANRTVFCEHSHAATARVLYSGNADIVDRALENAGTAPLDARMRALLVIADKVRRGGRRIAAADIAAARNAGADDRAIHDTVLIAAAFCMFNRYVDGLDTNIPTEAGTYVEIGARLAAAGYANAVVAV